MPGEHLTRYFRVDGIGVIEQWRVEEGIASVQEQPDKYKEDEMEASMAGTGGSLQWHRIPLAFLPV
jgi:hypothetical protein